MSRRKSLSRGMTLVEIMAALAVSGILLSVIVVLMERFTVTVNVNASSTAASDSNFLVLRKFHKYFLTKRPGANESCSASGSALAASSYCYSTANCDKPSQKSLCRAVRIYRGDTTDATSPQENLLITSQCSAMPAGLSKLVRDNGTTKFPSLCGLSCGGTTRPTVTMTLTRDGKVVSTTTLPASQNVAKFMGYARDSAGTEFCVTIDDTKKSVSVNVRSYFLGQGTSMSRSLSTIDLVRSFPELTNANPNVIFVSE